MDTRLEEAKRAFEQNTTDTEAAQRYEAELLRAGKHQDVVDLYLLANECKKTWSQLQRHNGDKIKYCHQCKETVIRVENLAEFMGAVERNQCVAIESASFDKASDALREKGLLSFARGKGKRLPCVVAVMPDLGSAFTAMGRPGTRGRPARR